MILSRSSCKMNLRGSSLEVVQFNLALSALLFLSPNSAVLVFRRRVLNAGIKPTSRPYHRTTGVEQDEASSQDSPPRTLNAGRSHATINLLYSPGCSWTGQIQLVL